MSQKIQKIMVAVDFSDYTEPSVQYAVGMAKELKATLLLVNVFNIRDLAAVERSLAVTEPVHYQNYLDDAYRTRHHDLEGLIAMAARQGVDGKGMVKTGVPHQELLNVIESEKPDLLIMGTKGRSNFADTLIGSCAHRMYYRCPIPLLSLRPPKK